MEITHEIKAKVFAQYLGNSMLINKEESNFVSINRSGRINKLEHNPDVCQLVLKKLSDIEDEDAIEVLRMRFPNIKFKDVVVTITGIHYREKLQYSWRERKLEFEGEISLSIGQYLQSKGYDLPQYLLEGKTLSEAGLAVYE